MKLRTGKTKSTLESSLDSALLAVEIYNKPRASFRTQAYISLMIIAWTRLFHAHFHQTIGDKYYYKKKGSNRYEKLDGDRKAWELKTCLKKYGNLSEGEISNLEFFIKLRNKIEHRFIDKNEFDSLIFGECQSLLFNYETTLIALFGDEYAICENLVYSLQFSTLRNNEQIKSNKRALSKEYRELKSFVEKYRSALSQDTFDTQEYSIKLIQIPKITNTARNDLAVEFVHWNSLSENDKELYKKLDVLVKDKIVKKAVINTGGMKPGTVLKRVESKTGIKLSHNDHRCILEIFRVRPDQSDDPFNTIEKYCLYDDLHNDYVYYQPWVDCLIKLVKAGKMKQHSWKQSRKHNRRYSIDDYL